MARPRRRLCYARRSSSSFTRTCAMGTRRNHQHNPAAITCRRCRLALMTFAVFSSSASPKDNPLLHGADAFFFSRHDAKNRQHQQQPQQQQQRHQRSCCRGTDDVMANPGIHHPPVLGGELFRSESARAAGNSQSRHRPRPAPGSVPDDVHSGRRMELRGSNDDAAGEGVASSVGLSSADFDEQPPSRGAVKVVQRPPYDRQQQLPERSVLVVRSVVVGRAVTAFFHSLRARKRQLLRLWATVVVAFGLCWGSIPTGAIAATEAPSTGPSAVIGRVVAVTTEPSRHQQKPRLVATAVLGRPTSRAGTYYSSTSSAAESLRGDEHRRGLEQLKRNLLREGIDPHQDWEGRRQVHFYVTGIDLATSPLGPTAISTFDGESTEGGATNTARKFVERQLERAQWQYAPQSMASKVRHQRQVLSCVVQDLEARGIDPLLYMERNPHTVQRILQLSDGDAERLATLYRRNLNRYGQIMSSQIRFVNSLERNVLAPTLSILKNRPVDQALPPPPPPPPFRDYLLPQPSQVHAASSRSAPDWFDESDAKVASDSAADSQPQLQSKQRSPGRKTMSKEKSTRTTSSSTAAPREATPSVVTGTAAPADSAPSTSSSMVGTIRKRYLVPAMGLVLIGAAALQVAGGGARGEDDDDESSASNEDADPSGQEQDFQRLYTLLTGDVGSYKKRLLPEPETHAEGDVKDDEPSPRSPEEFSTAESAPATEDAAPSDAIPTEDPKESRSVEATSSLSTSAPSLFTRWMPHRRYSPDSTSQVVSAVEPQVEVSPTDVAPMEASDDVAKSRLLSDALAMSRVMSVAELATMKIPASPGAAGAGSSTAATQPRDLFDLLSTIEDERHNEFARQLAKLLALGAPAEFFWHVHSLSGGSLPVDVTSRGTEGVQQFLREAREAAGIEDAADARQLFDDVKRCMMTDMMEFESKLLQGSTTADAIHHVVDFMAHVSTVHDALALSCTSSAVGPAITPSNRTEGAASATTELLDKQSSPANDGGDPAPVHNSTSTSTNVASSLKADPPPEMESPSANSKSTAGPSDTGVAAAAGPRLLTKLSSPVDSSASTAAAVKSPPDKSVVEAAASTSPPPASTPQSLDATEDPAPAPAPAVVHRPSYDESYESIKSFLENIHDTYTGTGGLY